MSDVLEKLVLQIQADVTGLRADLGKGEKEVEKFAKSATSSFETIKASVVALAATITAKLTLGAFTDMIAKSMEAIDAQAKLADRLGITTDELAALSLAADLSGTSVYTVARASNMLSRQLEEAKGGSKEAAQSFAMLGLSLNDLSNMKSDQQMGAVADALNNIKDASQRTTIQFDLFGRSAMELDAFIRDGSQGIADAKAQVDALGGAISRVDMEGVEKANDSWTSMVAIVTRVKDELAAQLAPAIDYVLKNAITFTTDFIKRMGGVRQMISDTLISTLTFADGWVRTAQTIGGVLTNLGALIKAAFGNVVASIDLMWAGSKLMVAKFVAFSGTQISELLFQASALVRAVKGGQAAADALMESAYSIGRNSGMGATEAEIAFGKAKNSALDAAEATKAAFKGIFDVDNSGSATIQKLIADLHMAALTPQAKQEAAPSMGEFSGGTASASPAVSKAQADAAAKLQILRKSLMDERELEMVAYSEKIIAINAMKDEQFLFDGERYALIEGLKAQHEAKLTGMEQEAADKRKALAQQELRTRLSNASTFFSNMSSLMNSGSKKLFAIGKASAYATTIVNTAEAAMSCFAAGSKQGGPYLGAAYAAAAIAAGAVQLATISGASPGGGGSVSSGGMGVPSISGSNPNSPNVGVNQNGSSSQDLNITVNGVMDKNLLIQLAEELNKLRGDGVVIGNIMVSN